MSSFPNDPFLVYKRKGDRTDPFLPYNEPKQVYGGKVVLTEIPDKGNHVTVKDSNNISYAEVYSQASLSANNVYYVDYDRGIVYFDASKEGLTFTFNYLGVAVTSIPATRVYTQSANGTVTQDVQDMIDNYNQLNGTDLYNLFDPQTGHKHTGGAGDAPAIDSQYVTYNNGSGTVSKVKDTLDSHAAQLADIMIDVGSYKTNANTWGQALQAAINYAGSIYSSQSELGNVYAAQNVLVKMPRGRYVLTETITGVKGIDFDFSGSTFVASPSDNSLTFLDFTDKIFRSYWKKGTFVGYKTAVKASTANVDTSNFVWDSPTFQSCSVGIDTISYSDSRSTFIQLKNVYSIKTDCLIKTHSDLTQIDGGWIYHTGYNGAAIYNQGFTKITNLICVPAVAQSGARPRWIDNYSEDAGSTTILGQRGLFIDHCRFGGETGSMPIVFNYATNDQDLTVYQGTIIDIQNSIMSSAGTSDLANIILFALPNRISIKNCTGFTNLTNGVIHCDSTFNSTTVANSRYISIEVDNTSYASPSFPLIDSDLYRFLKTKENLNTQFRSTFTSGKTHLRYTPVSAGTDAGTSRPLSKITVNVSTPTIDNTTYGTDYGIGFFVIINAFDSASGTYAYKSQSLYYVGTSGGYNSGKVKILNFTSLAQYAGGSSNSTTTAITSVLWSTTQANQVPIANNENIDVVFFGNPSYSRVTIVPVFGLTSDVS